MKGIRIRPEKRGLRVVLFDLEADIMDLVWSESWDTFSVQEVVDGLSGQRDLAYTTVLTTVRRLFDKGILGRVRDGRRYLYAPLIARADYVGTESKRLVDRLFGGRAASLVAHLADQEALTEDDLAEIEALLKELKQ